MGFANTIVVSDVFDVGAVGPQRPAGRVIAADSGNPLRRAQVRILGTEVRVNQAAITDGDGRYEFSKVPAGRYTINVTRNGYVSLQFGQQRPFEPGKPLTIADGEVAEKIDFALPRGSVIAGRVTDETGEPMRLAGVHRELQEFLSDSPRGLVELPRDHGKTVQVMIRIIWEIGRNPNLRVLLASGSDKSSPTARSPAIGSALSSAKRSQGAPCAS